MEIISKSYLSLSKIGSTALGALHGLWAAQKRSGADKSFGIIMCPSHVTRKWVREIGETLPDTYAMVVHSIAELDRLYAMYEQGDKSVYAVFSKERARDGYMRYPAVKWSKRLRAFLCPDCNEVVTMEISEDGSRYTVPADQFFFQNEHRKNHVCPNCGSVLWSAVNPGKRIEWVKIGEYGWVHRYGAAAHLRRTKSESVIDQLTEIAQNPEGFYPVRGAQRRYPLSTYIKKKMRGRISGFLCDELHEYNNNSGQGDAMAELFGVSKLFVGMTATLINGYSSGIFHLLYRIVPGLMLKDGKSYRRPADFDAEYGVVENTYEIKDGEYNSNRRTTKRKAKSRQLPGVSPLVFSRFLLEYTAFLSLSDMNKDLPDYEEIPVPLEMPEDVHEAYKEAEKALQKVLRTDRKAAQKILSTYLNLLTVYPDQPYDQPEVIHPIEGEVIIKPKDCGDFTRLFPKEETVLDITRRKIANGERVLIYTSWTRTDSQKKLLKLLREEGYRTEILTPQVPTEKREEWVDKRVKNGLQVLITNPRCVETGLDLNAFMENMSVKKNGVTMHFGDRFCMGGKKPRKFGRGDPKIYVPTWCPKRKVPSELRIYGFKSVEQWMLHHDMCEQLGTDISPSAFRYAVAYELHTPLTPREFAKRCNEEPDAETLGVAVHRHYVVEIDDGIKPEFFYKTQNGYVLLGLFDAATARKNVKEDTD